MNLLDVGYWGWNRAFASYKAKQEGRTISIFDDIIQLIRKDTVLAFDGKWSLRKNSLPWYKANRSEGGGQLNADLRVVAEHMMLELQLQFPQNVYIENGLEGDDIIALHAKPGDMIWGNDKDYLQLPKDILLTNLRGEFWGMERFKTQLPVNRGTSALAFQLLYGDVADNIPRRYYGDKSLIDMVFDSENPLLEAIKLIDPRLAKLSLAALVLPTPLYNIKQDIITTALELVCQRG